ncbi:S-adenosyl-L-methionine-dependent methyltransferase [Aspergillus floccosus]
MTASEIDSLLGSVASSLSEYKTSGKEASRFEALEKTKDLTLLLEKPDDLFYKLFFSPTVPMAVKVAGDMEIFVVLNEATHPVTWKELAAPKNAAKVLVERIMRILVSHGFAKSHGPGKYTSTPFAREFAKRGMTALMDFMFLDCLPVIQKTPMFLKHTNYQNPGNPLDGPLQYAYHFPHSCWDWFASNPVSMERFNSFMEVNRASLSHWAEWYPVQERLLEGLEDGPFLVDVGGGHGHELLGFKQRFPDVPGQLVLEDLPEVIDGLESLDSEVKRVKHDFFEPQPVKDSRVYYFKYILHDWSDDNCRIILDHTKAAMKEGYSKLLIEDFIVSELHPAPRHTMMDMVVMALCPGIERTQSMWIDLLGSAGLQINGFWTRQPDGLGIIEAELRPNSPEDEV